MNIFRDIHEYRLDYSILAILSGVFVLYFLKYRADSNTLLIATAIYAFCYFLWGVLHQLRSGSLHLRVVLEYLLVGILAIALVSTLLL